MSESEEDKFVQDASQRLQRIKSKKRELKGAQRKSKKKVQALKEVRQMHVNTYNVFKFEFV